MDAFTKNMLGVTTGLQATSLALSNVPSKKKKKLVKKGVGNMLGIGLIGAQSDMISKF